MVGKIFFMLLLVLCTVFGKFRSYPRNVNNATTGVKKRQDADYYGDFRCDGYHFQTLDTLPDGNCGSVAVEGSTAFVKRDCSRQPIGFCPPNWGYLLALICLDDITRIVLSVKENGDPVLVSMPADGKHNTNIQCELISYQESAITGCYIARLLILMTYYFETSKVITCPLGVVENKLSLIPQHCVTNGDNQFLDPPEDIIVSVQAVKYVFGDDFPDNYWSGLFTICVTNECEQTVVSANVGEQHLPIRSLLLLSHAEP